MRQFVEQKKFGYWKQSCTHKHLCPPPPPPATTSPSRTAAKEARVEPDRVRQPGLLDSPLRHPPPLDGEATLGSPFRPLSAPSRGPGAGWSGADPGVWAGLVPVGAERCAAQPRLHPRPHPAGSGHGAEGRPGSPRALRVRPSPHGVMRSPSRGVSAGSCPGAVHSRLWG